MSEAELTEQQLQVQLNRAVKACSQWQQIAAADPAYANDAKRLSDSLKAAEQARKQHDARAVAEAVKSVLDGARQLTQRRREAVTPKPVYGLLQLSETVTLELLQVPGESCWLGRYPVTQEQYEAIIGSNPSNFKGRRRPVEQVNWEEAQAFCRKLQEKFGGSFGLPREAIWEKACRAGTSTSYNNGTDNDSGLSQVAWYSGNSGSETHEVGGKRPNAWGFYDMHGNVWEWCEEWYSSGSSRVIRGGSWGSSSDSCTSSCRSYSSPGYRSYDLGFRVCWRPRS